MIHIPDGIKDLQTILIGDPEKLDQRPLPVWQADRIAFLVELSKALLSHKDVKRFPDVVTFAFWIRKANLSVLQSYYFDQDTIRVGLGLSFHICPSNVPVNFAYSMVFGLLAGNSCVLRLPSRKADASDLILEVLEQLLKDPNHKAIYAALLILRYGHNDDVSAFWLGCADARIIWGGNQTVQHMRQFDTPPRSREVAFPDRYSLCTIDAKALLSIDEKALDDLYGQLYNDIYIMDQAACSSPQLLVWTGSDADINVAKETLWAGFNDYVKQRYEVKPIQIMDKFVAACDEAIENSNVKNVQQGENILYRVELEKLDPLQHERRGHSGLIHELSLSSLADLAPNVSETYQTLTYFGYDQSRLKEFVETGRLRGIDRIVPVGKALDMDIIWDGYDMISSLSRIVDVS